jgi:signal transduction histidine kinase
MHDVDLSRVLREVMGFMHVDADSKSVELREELEENLVVRGDKDLLYRAFYNIVGNAVQAVPEGSGRVEVILKAGESGPVAEVGDNGPGFEAELLERYMEPFYTTKDSGTGLGLAIARNILESHGASLELGESEAGGARVRVEFRNGSAEGKDNG